MPNSVYATPAQVEEKVQAALNRGISASAKGFKTFTNPAAADAFFTATPPAEDTLFIYTDPAESKADFYRRASDNTTQVLRVAGLTAADKSQIGVAAGENGLITGDQAFKESITGSSLNFIAGYIDTSGNIITNTSWRHSEPKPIEDFYEAYLSVSAGATTGSYLDIAFYTEAEANADNFISGLVHLNSVARNYEKLIIPPTAKYYSVSKDSANSSHEVNVSLDNKTAVYLSEKNAAEKIDLSQAGKLIDDATNLNIDISQDINGIGAWSQTSHRALGQYYKVPSDFTFNQIKAAVYMNTSTFDLEVRVYTSAGKTRDTLAMTLIQTFNFDETNAPIEGITLSLNLSEALSVSANTYVYVLAFSSSGFLAIRRKNSTDRFLYVENSSLTTFPPLFTFALSDSYGTTGLSFYNVNAITATQQKAESNETKIASLEAIVSNEVNRELYWTQELNLIEGEEYTVYKSSIIRNRLDVLKSLIYLYLDTPTGGKKPRRYITGLDDITFNSSDANNFLSLLLRDLTLNGQNFIVSCVLNKVAANAKSGQTIIPNIIGNSLTNRGVLKHTIEYATSINSGLTWNPIGTETNSGFSGEGREGWTFKNFYGGSNRHPFTNAVIYSPFVKIASSTDKTNHPEWCFQRTDNANELNYTEISDTGQDFYIFDYDDYLTKNSFADPTHVSIALGTNDISAYGSGSLVTAELGIEIMLTQIKAARPAVEVAVISGTAKGYSISESYRNLQLDLANVIQKKISELALDITVIPVAAFQSEYFIFPEGSKTFLNDSGNYTENIPIGDNIHFKNPEGYRPYAQLMLGWFLNKG